MVRLMENVLLRQATLGELFGAHGAYVRSDYRLSLAYRTYGDTLM